ncbi:FAS-associated death domain protein-like [Macrotis lagotis]|uniref:FAS-associated death domain protein-like n=1 Tax=Macrotis lagotis TaxID=92651 RepID=UPI003D6999B5
MEKEDSFLAVLHHISSNLSRQELENMKFLCKMKIGKKQLKEIEQGIELFSCLMQQNLLSVSNTTFLTSMLQSLKREDLLQELANSVENKYGPGELLDLKMAAQLEVTFQMLCHHMDWNWKRLVRKLGIFWIINALHPDLKEQFNQSLILWKKIH